MLSTIKFNLTDHSALLAIYIKFIEGTNSIILITGCVTCHRHIG